MSLQQDLILNKPREVSGSSSSNRFQFQKDWAICKLIEMQLSNEEYVVIMDFHDDVLIIDSDVNPQLAKFYQLKTKADGHWTLQNLIACKKDSNSFIGKLYYNKLAFPNSQVELNFVSNAHYKVNIKGEESPDASLRFRDICINLLDNKSQEKIANQIVKEFALTDEPSLKNIIYLRVTELSINSRETYTKGKLSEFFDRIDTESKVNPVVAYRMLSSEIGKRNDYEWQIQSFEEMLTYKGITKSEFARIINELISHSQVYSDWNNIESNLLNCGIGIKEIKVLKSNWRAYEIDRMKTENVLLGTIRQRIIELIKSCGEFPNYKVLIEDILNQYKNFYKIDNVVYDEDYIKSMILMEFCLC